MYIKTCSRILFQQKIVLLAMDQSYSWRHRHVIVAIYLFNNNVHARARYHMANVS